MTFYVGRNWGGGGEWGTGHFERAKMELFHLPVPQQGNTLVYFTFFLQTESKINNSVLARMLEAIFQLSVLPPCFSPIGLVVGEAARWLQFPGSLPNGFCQFCFLPAVERQKSSRRTAGGSLCRFFPKDYIYGLSKTEIYPLKNLLLQKIGFLCLKIIPARNP